MVRKIVLVVLALALSASVGAAQAASGKSTELTAGVLGLSYTTCSGCDGLFIASTGGTENGVFSGLGGGSIGLGFYVSPGMAIEPTLSFSSLSGGGETFTIITNDGRDAIGGTFSGLPEGASLAINGLTFQISYVGGTGNDVVLTVVG